MVKKETSLMEKVVNLAKRRGFVFPSAEIYGGLGGFWDWGPLGVLLKNNIKNEWWKTFVQEREDVAGIDGAIITNPKVWEASGHVRAFRDVLMECKNCHVRYKADDILPASISEKISDRFKKDAAALDLNPHRVETIRQGTLKYLDDLIPEINKAVKCPSCSKHDWTRPEDFNTMFWTNIGPVSSRANIAFLRPETAQNIFANYELVRDTMRMKLPFGIAQIGKVFRNEITPGNFVYRSREFEQMELEYFVTPGADDEWFEKWVEECESWFLGLGLRRDNLRLRKQSKNELAHYAKATTDIEYAFPIEKGWAELIGVSNRTDYDLRQHGKFARGDEQTFATAVDDEGKNKKVPYVIEPSFGVDRAALAFLLDAYEEVEGGRTTTTESTKELEVVLRLDKRLAPIKVGILPLSKKSELQNIAHEIHASLRTHWQVQYDEIGSIGRRYRRQDEIGTPFCVTIDFDTIDGTKRPKGTVTARDRDTMAQEDVAIGDLTEYFREKLR